MTKKKTNSRPGLPKAKLKFTDHIQAFVNSYTSGEYARKQIMKAYLSKMPKPHGVVYLPVYQFSKYTLLAFHLISFVFACSVVYFIASLPLSQVEIYGISFLLVAFLALCEKGQHSTLNTLFQIFFQSGSIPSRLATITFVFSIISIVSSSYGITYFFVSKGFENDALKIALCLVSVVCEFFILANTYDLHKYESKTHAETVLINDLHYTNGMQTFFLSETPKLPQNPPILPEETTAEQAPKAAGKAEIIEEPYNDAATVVKAVTTSNFPLVDGWNKTDINNNISSYKNKIKQRKSRGQNPTKEQLRNLHFFEKVKQLHDFRKGNFEKVKPEDRKDYFKNTQNQGT